MKRFAKLSIIALAVATAAGCAQIDSGNIGVMRTLGKVQQEPLLSGIHFYFPFTSGVQEFTTKEIPFFIVDQKPQTKDQLTMEDVDMDIFIKVNGSKIPALVTKYQGDVKPFSAIQQGGNDDLVVAYDRLYRMARGAIYDSINRFEAKEVHLRRADIEAEVAKNLQASLNASDPDTFTVTTVNSKMLKTDNNIDKQIRDQVAMDQQIIAKEKEKRLEALEAEKRLIRAEGEAKANRALAESLTPQLLRSREIDAQMLLFNKGGASTVIVPYGQPVSPIIAQK